MTTNETPNSPVDARMSVKVSDLIPKPLVNAIHGAKLLGVMNSTWDRGDVDGAMLILDFSMGSQKGNFSDHDLAIGKLLFMVLRTSQLDAVVYPHADYALSSYISKCVNAVWAANPGLIAPKVHWISDALNKESGNSLAEMLCIRGILLDPQVLDDGPKQALAQEFASTRCIGLAQEKYRLGILDMMATLSPAAAEAIYSKLCEPILLESLCDRASGALVVGCSRAVTINGEPRTFFDQVRINNSLAARRLLVGMATAGAKSPQVGWASGIGLGLLDAAGQLPPPALKCVAERSLTLAGIGYDLDGLRQLVRAVGTIIGYDTKSGGDKALTLEFAGAVSMELLDYSNPLTDLSIGPMLVKYVSKDTEGGSFFDGLLKYFYAAEVLPDQPIAKGACTLEYALRKSMPPGIADGYEAMCRARAMAGVIANAGAENIDCVEKPRRRGMRL